MTNDALLSLQNALQQVVGATKVYIGDLPELDENCMSIRPVDGYPSTLYLGMPDTLEPLVEVLIRNREYAVGTDVCSQSLKVLDKYTDESVGILLTKPVGSPGYLGRNVNGFGEWHFVVHVSLVVN